MIYKFLRIDMDYCSDPLWGKINPESSYINLGLDDYKQYLSKNTLSVLKWYTYLWEWYNWGGLSDEDAPSCYIEYDLSNAISDIQIVAAKLVKNDLPDYNVCYNIYREKYIDIEL